MLLLLRAGDGARRNRRLAGMRGAVVAASQTLGPLLDATASGRRPYRSRSSGAGLRLLFFVPLETAVAGWRPPWCEAISRITLGTRDTIRRADALGLLARLHRQQHHRLDPGLDRMMRGCRQQQRTGPLVAMGATPRVIRDGVVRGGCDRRGHSARAGCDRFRR